MADDEPLLKGLQDRIQRVAVERDRLRQNLGAEKFAQVEDLASRLCEINRRVLDIAHTNGLITDKDYEKCLARGNEFAPMCWIIRDFA